MVVLVFRFIGPYDLPVFGIIVVNDDEWRP